MNITIGADRAPKGIRENNRRRLTELHRNVQSPFTVGEASLALELSVPQTQRFLAYLVHQGWLARIRRGLYSVVPLDALNPNLWLEDPWLVATKIFGPSFYIGGWSACEHWGLTEQLFRDTYLVTTRKLRSHTTDIQGFSFRVKTMREHRMFGTVPVWRGQSRVNVSDHSRTIVDLLDDPSTGGGMRHVLEVLENYLSDNHRNDRLLVEYVNKFGNRTIFKRLGYLLEILEFPNPRLIESCREGMSSGISLLDPNLPNKGRIISRWNLRVNQFLSK